MTKAVLEIFPCLTPSLQAERLDEARLHVTGRLAANTLNQASYAVQPTCILEVSPGAISRLGFIELALANIGSHANCGTSGIILKRDT